MRRKQHPGFPERVVERRFQHPLHRTGQGCYQRQKLCNQRTPRKERTGSTDSISFRAFKRKGRTEMYGLPCSERRYLRKNNLKPAFKTRVFICFHLLFRIGIYHRSGTSVEEDALRGDRKGNAVADGNIIRHHSGLKSGTAYGVHYAVVYPVISCNRYS